MALGGLAVSVFGAQGIISQTFKYTTQFFQAGGFLEQYFPLGLYRGGGALGQRLMTLSNVWTDISTNITEFDTKDLGGITELTTNNPIYKYVKSIPITSNFTLGEFVGDLTSFDRDRTLGVLKEVTGVNIAGIVENVTSLSLNSIQGRIQEFLGSIEQQIANEITSCIDGYLMELLDKIPELDILLDIEGWIMGQLGNLRMKLRLDIESQIEKLLYQKIKLQQVSMFKQKITDAVRKICPSHHSPPPVTRISPTLTKRLQEDQTWKLVDGVTPLKEKIVKGEIEDIHFVQETESTGELVETITKEVAQEIKVLSVNQTLGYGTDDVSSFVNSDGTLVV